ncbi:sigma-70 family RNA polymerase sigma factor [Streptococcus loxodontisalivarius]|uniref:Competence protein ComX n=1 Tax=Streptococcus loxodontisalivarius TaxID=1349415 RepID=A0ABS2PUR8_9STRE|nr:sigma-70 family RNA polymerase sigma factor [Streptococcus loxodontisalivarius]MBM7643799.1 competence protein ComX [Streptococcus loxodontisalivarius]
MESHEFLKYYSRVRPIVLKLRKEYSLKLWELEDWEQEGQIILYQLLIKNTEVISDSRKLFVFFKTKFSNYVKDQIRKQESYKRKFDKMVYEDVWENSSRIANGGMKLDEFVAFNEIIDEFKSTLSDDENEVFDRIITGGRIRGKEKMMKELRVRFSDFKNIN